MENTNSIEVRIARMRVESANAEWLKGKTKFELVQMWRDVSESIGNWYRFWTGCERGLSEAREEKRWLNRMDREISSRLSAM